MYIWSPVSSRFYFVFFGHHVSEADFLGPVETEVRLFVDLRRAVGVRGYGAVFHSETLCGRFGEGARGRGEGPEVREGWMGWWEERHCKDGRRTPIGACSSISVGQLMLATARR